MKKNAASLGDGLCCVYVKITAVMMHYGGMCKIYYLCAGCLEIFNHIKMIWIKKSK